MNKTIVEKLNLQKYKTSVVLNLPGGKDYLRGLKDYETNLNLKSSYDLIFAFVLDMDSLKKIVFNVIENNLLNKNGYLYAAYPKKGNKIYSSFIHRDDLLKGLDADENGYVGTSNIKFARMVGLDETFTIVGLKEDTQNRNKTLKKASQCVDDYIDMIPSIENHLKSTPKLLQFYQSLTQGYRKDWARYVYSAKQDRTREKRLEEMKIILGSGYKSRDLYNRDK